MRFDSVPVLNNSSAPQPGVKSDRICLDLSTRSKIVIQPRIASTTTRTIIPGPSIFSSRSNKKPDVKTPTKVEKPEDLPKSALKPSRPITDSSSTLRKRERSSGPARDEKVEKAKLAKARATVEKRVRIVEPQEESQMPAPVIPAPSAKNHRPYAEECAKCGCTSNGQPPCQTCQFLLLADKFCDLVYRQCEKWNIQI